MYQRCAVEGNSAQAVGDLDLTVADGCNSAYFNIIACQNCGIVAEIGLCGTAVDQHVFHEVMASTLVRICQDGIRILTDRVGICQRQTIDGNGDLVHHLSRSHIDGELTIFLSKINRFAIYSHNDIIGIFQFHSEVYADVVLQGNVPTGHGIGELLDLLGNHIAAGRAGLGLRACCSVGRCSHDPVAVAVTQSSNFFLCNSHFAANGTVLTFGQAGIGAICCYCSVDHFGVTQSRDLFLGNDYLAANRAVLTFGQAGFSTSSCFSRVDHFGVTQSSDLFLGNDHLAANRAVLTLGQAGFSTSSCFSSVGHFGVTQSLDFITSVGIVTSGTSIGGIAILGTGGSCHNRSIAVTQCRNFFLCDQHFTASSTVLAFGQAGIGAGCRFTGNNVFGVTLCGNNGLRGQHFITYRAVLTFSQAIGGTGYIYSRVNHFGVGNCSNILLFNDHCAADRAVAALGQTGCSTGSFHSRIDHFCVASCSCIGIFN